MPGKSPAERRQALAIEAAILAVFEAEGFAHIAPDILQPADIFLERSGEEIRASAFLFSGPGGEELCLRPDLTVPACRYYLSHGEAGREAKLCYCGPVFRFAGDTGRSEATQTGVEWLGGADPEIAEAEVLKLSIAAVEAAGVTRYRVLTGDLALFSALIDDFEMPERWRRRLKHHFWRPGAFREVLQAISGDAVRLRNSSSPYVDALGAEPESFVIKTLEAEALPLIGGRSAAEIAARLGEKAADRSERPLSRAEAQRIHDYLAIAGAPEDAANACAGLDHGRRFAEAVARFRRRAGLIAASRETRFAATFGRTLEYYTGFVFQIEADGRDGPLPLAGGGRYDDLLSDIGAVRPVPAVGCAVYPERIAEALRCAA